MCRMLERQIACFDSMAADGGPIDWSQRLEATEARLARHLAAQHPLASRV
jgi:hypothetical protein